MLWGLSMALVLNGLFLSRIGYVVCECNTLFYVVASIFAVLFGMLVSVVHRHKENDPAWHPRKMVIFLKTACPGSYMLVKSLGHFAGGFPDEIEMARIVALPGVYYFYVCLIIALA